MYSINGRAAAADRLSELSDDILSHILSFVPSSEAARATALSRRWRRPLWLHTGAVHMDYRSYSTTGCGVPDRQLLVSHADQACACIFSSGRFPKKLSIVMPDDAIVCDAGGTDDERDVEDLAGIEAVDDAHDIEFINNSGLPRYTPPFAAIRLLELTGYDLKPYSDKRRQLAFPRLQTMHLHGCRTELAALQTIISAAPRLADLRLESLSFVDLQYEYMLSCEAATSIVMANCGVLHDNLHLGDCRIRLDAPRLLCFCYAHVMVFQYSTSFSFGLTPPPHLEQVHLEVHSGKWETAYHPHRSFLDEVSYVRYLKLTACAIADLNIHPMPVFPNIERLEIEELCGWSVVNHGAAAEALVKLLRRLPSLVELRVKFSWRRYLREINADPVDEMAAIADFWLCKSVHGNDNATNCCDALVGLHNRFCYGTMVSGLRRVVVEFDAEELTCFQVRLIWFLAISAVDLQEFLIDGGKGYDSRCIDQKVESWRKRWSHR